MSSRTQWTTQFRYARQHTASCWACSDVHIEYTGEAFAQGLRTNQCQRHSFHRLSVPELTRDSRVGDDVTVQELDKALLVQSDVDEMHLVGRA